MEPFIYIIVYSAVVIFLLLYFYFTRNFEHWRKKNVPFIKPMPFVGNALSMLTMRQCIGEFLSELHNQFKEPVFGFFILDKPYLLIRDPQICHRILVKDFQNFCDRGVLFNKRDDPISSHILFFLKNPDWKELRSKITPVFTPTKMKAMLKLMESSSGDMVQYLRKAVARNSFVNVKDLGLKYSVDVITSTAFGVKAYSFENQQSAFYREALRIINWEDFVTSFRIRCYFIAHIFVKIFKFTMFNPISVEFFKNNFWYIMDKRADMKNTRDDLIDTLLQLKNDDTHLDGNILVSQALTFFVAGFETSSSAVSFALHELAHNPEVQTKLREEVNEIILKYGCIKYEALQEMKYLDMCLKETLRKYPVLPFIERKCNKTYTIPETGTVIDEGISIFISSYGLHYDPQNFPDPDKFDPERFTDDQDPAVNTCYMPWGLGPRKCIGDRFATLAIKTALAAIVQNFVIETCPESVKKIKINPNGITLAANDKIKVKFTALI